MDKQIGCQMIFFSNKLIQNTRKIYMKFNSMNKLYKKKMNIIMNYIKNMNRINYEY